MLSGNDVAKWFICHNSELASGYIDENTKINKLIYFSNLMYYSLYSENLIIDDFVAFPNGPVVYAVYRDYRYNGLNTLPKESPSMDIKEEKILNIVNFIYGNLSTKELIKESHSHNLWKDVKNDIPNNPKIDFSKTDKELIEYFKMLYKTYEDMDFENLIKEKINNNIYYYFKNSFVLTEEMVERLSVMEGDGEPKFLEIIDGEMVVS